MYDFPIIEAYETATVKPTGQWTSENVVTDATRNHERAYHDLWARTGEFKEARQLVRALGIAQDPMNPSAVY